MKKILFLLLFLQSNLVFGQIKLLKHLRFQGYLISEPESQFAHTNKKKTVKKIVNQEPDGRIFTATYNEDGQLNQYEVQTGKAIHELKVFYHKNGLIDREEYTTTFLEKRLQGVDKYFRKYKMLKSKDEFTQCRISFEFLNQDTLRTFIVEKINTKNQKRELRFFNIDTEKWIVSIKDSLVLNKLIEINEANKRFELEDLAFFGYEIYQYEKGKPISKKILLNRRKELGEEKTLTLKYETETEGYVLFEDKVTNIFSLNENTLIDISPDGITKLEPSGLKFIYDENENWTISSFPYTDDDGKKIWKKTKRKIEYYD